MISSESICGSQTKVVAAMRWRTMVLNDALASLTRQDCASLYLSATATRELPSGYVPAASGMCVKVSKDILKSSKEKGCEILKEWSKAIKNHLYWCATSTKQGLGALIVAKWTSIVRHVNKHDNHPNPLYKKCHHGELEPRN